MQRFLSTPKLEHEREEEEEEIITIITDLCFCNEKIYTIYRTN